MSYHILSHLELHEYKHKDLCKDVADLNLIREAKKANSVSKDDLVKSIEQKSGLSVDTGIKPLDKSILNLNY